MTCHKPALAALGALAALLAAATAGEPDSGVVAVPRGTESAQHPPIYLGVRYSDLRAADL